MRLKYTISGIVFTTLFSGCNTATESIPSPDYMACSNIEYVKDFPISYNLDQAMHTDIDIIGITDFIIVDSLIIISTNDISGFWSFYSLNTKQHLGNYLKVGNGPNEFLYALPVSNATFYKNDANIMACLYDGATGTMREINISQIINEKRIDDSTVINDLPHQLLNFVRFDSNSYLCRALNKEMTQQERFILYDTIKFVPKKIKEMNLAQIQEGEDFNLISSLIKYHYTKQLFVEMPVYLNYINMYSAKGEYSKTICIGDYAESINQLQKKHDDERRFTFNGVQLYDKCFAILYINETLEEYVNEGNPTPSILFFDWNGNPLAKLNVNSPILAFDIDFTNNTLYYVNKEDIIIKCDVNDFIEKLNQICK